MGNPVDEARKIVAARKAAAAEAARIAAEKAEQARKAAEAEAATKAAEEQAEKERLERINREKEAEAAKQAEPDKAKEVEAARQVEVDKVKEAEAAKQAVANKPVEEEQAKKDPKVEVVEQPAVTTTSQEASQVATSSILPAELDKKAEETEVPTKKESGEEENAQSEVTVSVNGVDNDTETEGTEGSTPIINNIELTASNENRINVQAEDDHYTNKKGTLKVEYIINESKLTAATRTYGLLNNDHYTDKTGKLDVAKDNLRIELISDMQNGALELNLDRGTFTYESTPGTSGDDIALYRICNSYGCSNTAKFTITTKNYAPVAVKDAYILRQDTVLHLYTPKDYTAGLDTQGILTAAAAKLVGMQYAPLSNDKDDNGNKLTAQLMKPTEKGKIEFLDEGRELIYTPEPGFWGKVTATYKACDHIECSKEQKIEFTVQRNSGGPIARPDSYDIKKNEILVVEGEKNKSLGVKKLVGYKYGVLDNDQDPDNDPLIARLQTPTTKGELVDFSEKGTFTYKPGKCGVDTFTYKASDGIFESEATLVQINVLCGPEEL